jgi:hypothetical protein
MLQKLSRSLRLVALALIILGPQAFAQGRITSPKEFLGFNFGDDYQLANYAKISAYWRKLATESDRIVVKEIGKTSEGRTMLAAIVSAPATIRNLEHFRQIARSLALAESLSDEQAHALAKEGKAVVWIDGGLHASEVLGAQQLGEMVWQMVSRTDEETMRILNDDIIVFVHANPDGNDLTADWYNRDSVPNQRTNAPGLPRLYAHYIGHDDNRDFYGSTQLETEAMNRLMYHDWFPQIVYNHHQTGPAGTVMFSPPFRDPFNYYFDPIVVEELDLVGAAMHTRFESEGKPGVTMRSGSQYSTWWNGGLRTTAYFHNMVGILTETIGNPTPMRIPYTDRQVLPRADLPDPIMPQEWHFRQSIDYSITANRAILDLASRFRETFLFNIYRMGKNAIDRGNRDNWTITPSRVDRANQAFFAAGGGGGGRGGRGGGRGGRGGGGFDPYPSILHAADARDPRGYIISADQPDFLTAIKFINALREVNVTVHRATAAFTVNGKNYPAGSFVVFTAQAFRPHVLDMFEPQDHPNDFPYPGAPPTPPYDNAGWTLAYQMGVQFDRVLDGFSGPFVRVNEWNVTPSAGRVSAAQRPAGYFLSHQVNDAFKAVAQLLAAREDVYWLQAPATANGRTYPAGTLYVPAKGTTAAAVARIATSVGVNFDATASKPAGNALKLKQPRIGLMDVYGGSMPSGWTRWILEQWGMPYDRTFPPRLDLGNLNAKYDVIVVPSGLVPNPWGGRRGGGGGGGGDQAPEAGGAGGAAAADSAIEARLPAEYRNQRGRVTAEKTLAAIKTFVENGGAVIAYGGSTPALATYLGLPVTNHLAENGEPLPNTKIYIPGSVMRATVDTTQAIAAGVPSLVDVFFDSSPAFDLAPDAQAKGVKRIAWYDGKATLRSGWAWGQEYLDGGTAAIEATVGKGKVFLFAPEILQRAQPHGTFKFFFNGLFYGTGTQVKL